MDDITGHDQAVETLRKLLVDLEKVRSGLLPEQVRGVMSHEVDTFNGCVEVLRGELGDVRANHYVIGPEQLRLVREGLAEYAGVPLDLLLDKMSALLADVDPANEADRTG